MAQDPVNIGTAANDGTGDPLRVAFGKLNANDAELYTLMAGGGGETGAQILAKLLTVDGAGSGLDADLLDGQSAAAFAAAVHAHAISEVTGLTVALAAKLDASSYTAADVLAKLLTVDGPGSGLNADLLDGLSSAAFAAAVHSHAIADVTGLQSALNAKGDLSSVAAVSVDSELMLFSGTTGKLAKRASGNGIATLLAGVLTLTDPATFAAAAHTHAIADTTGLQVALDAKLPIASYTAADVLAKLLTVDGAGSGLDADLLDGQSAAAFAAASHTHAQSEVTGLVAALAAKLDASSYTAADVLGKLLTVDGAGSGLDADTLDGVSSAGFAASSHAHVIADVTGLQAALDAYTAADVLAKLLTVDGTGSGLDADLLDGQSAAAFAAASHAHAQSEVTGLVAALATKLDASSYTAADVLAKLITVDGTGSGLDADLLDGLSAAAFATASHAHAATDVTSGTLDAARVAATWPDNTELQIGTSADLRIYHNGTNTFVRNDTGHLFASLNVSSTPVNLDATQSLTVIASRFTYAALDSSNFDFISYATSYTSPTAPASGSTLGSFRFRAHDSTALRTVARMTAVATQTWTAGSAYGTTLSLANTATGATTAVVRLSLAEDQVLITSGTTALPGLSFIGDIDTGFSRPASNVVVISCNALEVVRIDSSGINISAAVPAFRLTETDAATDEGIWRTDVNSLVYRIRAFNDALSTNASAIAITRASGSTPGITDITFGHSGTTTVVVNATTFRLNTTTATTVGAAGGATALPATPLGYLAANVGGTAVKIPYYNN